MHSKSVVECHSLCGETGSVHGIPHRNSKAGGGEHPDVVLSVPKGHHVLGLDVVLVAEERERGRLVDGFCDDLDDVGERAGRLEGRVGEGDTEEVKEV